MTEIQIAIPASADMQDIVRAIEAAAVAIDLGCRLKCTLKSYPDSTHWHFCKTGARGTLELTLWPQNRRCWISLRESRSAEWVARAVEQLREALCTECGADPFTRH